MLVDNASQARDFETRTLPLLAELYQLAAGLTPTRRTAEDVTVQAYQRAFQQFAEAPPANSRLLLLRELIAAARRQRRWNWRGSSAGGCALDHLPHNLREAILLVDVAECSSREAAEILNVKVDAVPALLSVARARLQSISSAP